MFDELDLSELIWMEGLAEYFEDFQYRDFILRFKSQFQENPYNLLGLLHILHASNEISMKIRAYGIDGVGYGTTSVFVKILNGICNYLESVNITKEFEAILDGINFYRKIIALELEIY